MEPENRFTGWEDVSLTEEGIKGVKFAAKQINKETNSSFNTLQFLKER